jgi:hypothetical protein
MDSNLVDFRELCAELAEALERLQKQSVTASHTQFVELSNGRHPIPLGNDILAQDLMTNNLLDRTRAALAVEAVGPPRPIPVAECLPGAGDCDAEGRCWWAFEMFVGDEVAPITWSLMRRSEVLIHDTHWLPAHALPTPAQEGADG